MLTSKQIPVRNHGIGGGPILIKKKKKMRCNCDYYCGPTFKTDNRLLMAIRGYLLVVLLSFSRQIMFLFTSFPV
jgi:hypothetical protein